MKKYLNDYINFVSKRLEGNISKDDVDNLLIKINFFQHERLIHLLVTLFYGLFLFLAVLICMKIPLFIIICFILIFILIFYVRHYFFLENGVQYLYKLYDKALDKLK